MRGTADYLRRARFGSPEMRQDIGALRLNISGCINACGHHHAADIDILEVNKKSVEHFQISLGGRAGEDAAVGRIIGPSIAESPKMRRQTRLLG